jgi:hypothetical protein
MTDQECYSNHATGTVACAVTLFSAETFKAAVVKSLFGKIGGILCAYVEEQKDHNLREVQSLLRSASFHTRYVNDMCYIMFLRFLSNLDQEDSGESVHAMNALVTANPGIALVTDQRGNLLLHHLAGSFIFSFFMSRFSQENDGDSHVKFPINAYTEMEMDVDVDIYLDNDEDDAIPLSEANPFQDLVHKLICANRSALHQRNHDGDCPIHTLCSESIAGSDFLELLLWYSPSCAQILGTTLHQNKYPLHLLICQVDQEVDKKSPQYKCLQLLTEAFPQACLHEVEESVMRIQVNGGSNPSPQSPQHHIWSPYSRACVGNAHSLGEMMMNHVLSDALLQQQRFAHSSSTKRRHTNLLINIDTSIGVLSSLAGSDPFGSSSSTVSKYVKTNKRSKYGKLLACFGCQDML